MPSNILLKKMETIGVYALKRNTEPARLIHLRWLVQVSHIWLIAALLARKHENVEKVSWKGAALMWLQDNKRVAHSFVSHTLLPTAI